jgi:hypothetical protein
VAGGAWWIFSPKLLPDTSFCCGSHGTVLGHVVISIVAGETVANSCCELISGHPRCIDRVGGRLASPLGLACRPVSCGHVLGACYRTAGDVNSS